MNKYRIGIAAILTFSWLVCTVGAYPPDNAALLYYRAFVLMDSTSNMFMFNPPPFATACSVKQGGKDCNMANCVMISSNGFGTSAGGKSQAFGGCRIDPNTMKCCIIKDINDCNTKGCVGILPSGCEAMKGNCRVVMKKINLTDANLPESGMAIVGGTNTVDVNCLPTGKVAYSFSGGHYRSIIKCVKSGGEPNEHLKRFIEYNPAVDIAITASKIENCDWGIDPCNFTREFMPHLGGMRKLAYLLIADSKIAATEGDYNTAFERCLAVKRMAHHQTPTKFKMEGLVNITLEKMANERIKELLAAIDGNVVKLNWLKNEILAIESRAPLSLKDCIAYEKDMFGSCDVGSSGIHIVEMKMINDSNKITTPSITIRSSTDSNTAKDMDKQYIKMIFNDHYGRSYKIVGNEKGINTKLASTDYKATTEEALNLWDKPYQEAYEGFKKLAQTGPQIAFFNPDASGQGGYVFKMTMMDFGFSYGEDIRNQTLNNAIKTAIEVYLVKAKTGQLPQTLPAGTPKDLFSGQAFDYQKTQDGFILRCRGKELNHNKIHEFGFKVKS